MNAYTHLIFSHAVEGVKGYCGEAYANRNIAEKKILVLACEGPCIRGEIARLAANLVAREVPPYSIGSPVRPEAGPGVPRRARRRTPGSWSRAHRSFTAIWP